MRRIVFSGRSELIFRQIKHSGDNFSYVVADEITKEAAVVDPGFNADIIIPFLKDHGLKAKYIIATHHHGDHTADNERIKAFSGSAIVAHRLSTIRNANRIIVMRKGELVEAGTFEELMTKQGEFYRLYHLV